MSAGSRGREALVVFAGHADLKWLRLLRPGFRHCFALLARPSGWVVYNPLSHFTEVEVLANGTSEELSRWFRSQGYRVVACEAAEPMPVPAPWRPYTCVEAIKRVLGLRAPWVFTPWQLYRRLGGE
jgi:hypothetical protein